jgi:hypothetical protein
MMDELHRTATTRWLSFMTWDPRSLMGMEPLALCVSDEIR